MGLTHRTVAMTLTLRHWYEATMGVQLAVQTCLGETLGPVLQPTPQCRLPVSCLQDLQIGRTMHHPPQLRSPGPRHLFPHLRRRTSLHLRVTVELSRLTATSRPSTLLSQP